MPFGVKPVCSSCKINSSPIWRKGQLGEVLCNSCGLNQGGPRLTDSCGLKQGGPRLLDACGLKQGGPRLLDTATTNKVNGGTKGVPVVVPSQPVNGAPILRKSARIKPMKKSAVTSSKILSSKGKGRRLVFKKNQPVKAPTPVATVMTGDSVFHKDQYYQSGDVVSLVDHDGGVYYAQIRGFLSDQYNEKSAVITWLIPTINSPIKKFDPNTYILGPEEDLPRKMDYMEFVCHAPSDYFRARDAPYQTVNPKPNLCYIWTSIGPQIQVAPSIDEIFGISDNMSVYSNQSQERLDNHRNKDSSSETKTEQNRSQFKLRMMKRKYHNSKDE